MAMDYQGQIWQELSSPWRNQVGMSGQTPEWAQAGGQSFGVSPSGFTMGPSVSSYLGGAAGGAAANRLVGDALSGKLINQPLTSLANTGIASLGSAAGTYLGKTGGSAISTAMEALPAMFGK